MPYAITNGTEWLSGVITAGKTRPILTKLTERRYEYDDYNAADDVITGLYQNGYGPVATTLRIVPVRTLSLFARITPGLVNRCIVIAISCGEREHRGTVAKNTVDIVFRCDHVSTG